MTSSATDVGQGNAIDVIHVDELSKAQFKRDYWYTNRPLLIKGAVKHWRANKLWREPGYLAEKLRSLEVLTLSEPVVESDSNVSLTKSRTMAFESFFREITDGSDSSLWIHALPLLFSDKDAKRAASIAGMDKKEFVKTMSSLAKEDTNEFTFLGKTTNSRLYPGWRLFLYRNSFTDWHEHITDTHLMCQIYGDKEVSLLPPNLGNKLISRLYEKNVSSLNAEDEQLKEDINNAKPYKIIVEDGDALHIPVYWYHSVKPTSQDKFGITLAHAFASPMRVNGDFRYMSSQSLFKLAPIHMKPILLLARGIAFLQRKRPLALE
jgi:hypothetical protein